MSTVCELENGHWNSGSTHRKWCIFPQLCERLPEGMNQLNKLQEWQTDYCWNSLQCKWWSMLAPTRPDNQKPGGNRAPNDPCAITLWGPAVFMIWFASAWSKVRTSSGRRWQNTTTFWARWPAIYRKVTHQKMEIEKKWEQDHRNSGPSLVLPPKTVGTTRQIPVLSRSSSSSRIIHTGQRGRDSETMGDVTTGFGTQKEKKFMAVATKQRGFTMVLLWFYYGFTMVLLWF